MPEEESTVVEHARASTDRPALAGGAAPLFVVRELDRDDPDHMHGVGALWKRVYGDERGLLDIPNAARAVEDRYHRYSDYLAIFARSRVGVAADEMVAAVRVVRDSRIDLPIERFFPLGPLKRYTRFVEPQRLIVEPAWRRRRFASAPYGLSGLLFKSVVKRYLIDAFDTTLVIDAFSDSRESPLHAFTQMGAKRLGCAFRDEELASDTPSFAMLCSLIDVTTQALRADKSWFARYLLAPGQGD